MICILYKSSDFNVELNSSFYFNATLKLCYKVLLNLNILKYKPLFYHPIGIGFNYFWSNKHPKVRKNKVFVISYQN